VISPKFAYNVLGLKDVAASNVPKAEERSDELLNPCCMLVCKLP